MTTPPDEAKLADELERLSETCFIRETEPGNQWQRAKAWTDYDLARIRLADLVRGNLPAILAALRTSERARIEKLEAALRGASIQRRSDEGGGGVLIRFERPEDSWPIFRILSDAYVAALAEKEQDDG